MKRRALLETIAALLLALAGVRAQPPELRAERARRWFTDTPLVDQDGQRHAFYSDLLAPRTVLISAAFVGCSAACPLLTQRLIQVRDALGERFPRDIWFLTITVDPRNDGPAELKRFALRQGADGPGWRFLTGTPERVRLVLSRLGLWTDEPDAHQTTLIVGRAADGHWGKLRPDATAQALVHQIARFLPV
ncbi:MAG: SCO family protein [Burkholderiaceae bacterium]|nr:SCO family protein [Burkholderiaceae bacterium]